MAAVLIDPKTGERIQAAGTPQIDPATGERVQSPMKPPAAPIRGDLRPTSFEDQLTEIRPDNPNDSLLSRGANFVGNIGAAGMGTLLHPVNTAKGVANSILHPADTFKSTFDALNTRPADTTASLIGQSAAMAPVAELAPRIAAPVLEKAGSAMQGAGVDTMNHTIGALQRDFKRGANPGASYLEAGGGPALSMDSLAAKGANLKSATGAKIGAAYDNATKNNVLIPPSQISAAINPPIDAARAVITGPGGTGNVAPLDNFASSFNSTLYPRVSTGTPPGLTPNDVFGIKKNVSANTSWSDPTQFGMKKVSQQTAGALGGLLENAVPEVKPLNSQYQGLTNFANRAALRSQTGSMPLSSIVRRAGEGAVGATLGFATHNPLIAAGAGLAGTMAESVPLKTTLASGLYRGGRGAVTVGNKLRSLY